MTTIFGTITIGANPVQIPWTLSVGAAKVFLQVAPGATGGVKVGNSAAMTNDGTTPGIWLNSTTNTNPDATHQAGDSFSIQSQKDHDTVYPNQYFVHGTHVGDKVNYAIHIN